MEPEDLSTDQRETLKEFRRQVEDVLGPHHDDYYLTRWLLDPILDRELKTNTQALSFRKMIKSWNIRKAEKMLRKSLAWRELHDVDSLLGTWESPPVVARYLPDGVCGVDKEGSPVLVENVGRVDMKGLFHAVSVKDLIRDRLHSLLQTEDIVQRERQKRGKHPGGVTMVYDFEGFGLKQLWKPGLDLYGEVFQISETHFPGLLKACFVIKAPALFSAAYTFLKPFLHENTKKRVHVLGGDWKARLLQAVDADQLPVYLGGTQTDPDGDPRCPSKVRPCGDVPVSCYATHQDELQRTDLKQAVINKASMLQVDLDVVTSPSVIRWEFVTEAHDVSFGVVRAGGAEVVAARRVYSHLVPEVGAAVVTEPGHYVAVFDNKYSWTTSKKVHYKVEVVPQTAPTTQPAPVH